MFDFVPDFFIYLLIMSAVTYLVRMLPLVLVRGKITNRYLRSFLYYVPYSVLSVMTFPAIFFSTGTLLSAVIGCAVALTLALLKRNLITVAACSAASVLVVELVMSYISKMI